MKTAIALSLSGSLVFLPINQGVMAQSMPEEIRAMADVCSTGASIKFRGQIAGSLTRLLGKVVSGDGEVEISRNETEFLNSFKDERLRLEARRIYNDCAKDAIATLREKYRQQSRLNPEELDVVDGASSIVPVNRVFSLRVNQSAMLQGGGVLSLRESKSWRKNPTMKLTNRGSGTGSILRAGTSLIVPHRRPCSVTHMSDLDAQNFRFLYKCD